MRTRKGLISLVLVLVFLPLSVFAQEEVVITTYYPSPYGSYRDLTVGNNLRLETSPTAPANDSPQIEWRTVTARHWNIDQISDRLRFFTENNVNGALEERIYFTEDGNIRWFKASEVTVDPLNGVGGYTAVARFRDKSDTP